MSSIWTEGERSLLDTILNRLIPANPDRDIPAAGDLGIAEFIEEQILRNADLRADVTTLLNHAADLADGVPPSAVGELEAEFPAEFLALLSMTYMGYYSRPDIRALVGVGAHPVHPKGYEVVPETPEFMGELTAPVRARGPCYRDPTRQS